MVKGSIPTEAKIFAEGWSVCGERISVWRRPYRVSKRNTFVFVTKNNHTSSTWSRVRSPPRLEFLHGVKWHALVVVGHEYQKIWPVEVPIFFQVLDNRRYALSGCTARFFRSCFHRDSTPSIKTWKKGHFYRRNLFSVIPVLNLFSWSWRPETWG